MENNLSYIYNCKQISGLILKFRTFRLELITKASKCHVTVFLVILCSLLKQVFTKGEIRYKIKIIVCKMAYFGRFVSLMRSENLLCTRNCLLNLYQNASKSALKQLKKTIMPQEPKKPESPFLLYVRHIKTRFNEETPHLKYPEMLKRASKEWTALNLTEKEYYINLYNKNHEIYINKLNEYNNSITDEQKNLWKEKEIEYIKNNNEIKNKKKYEILGKPKKPPNAYFCYLSSMKNDKNPNMSAKEWIKSLSIRWKKLSDAEKESYITKAIQLRIQYEKDLENWEMKMIQSGHADFVRSKIVTKYDVTKEQEKE